MAFASPISTMQHGGAGRPSTASADASWSCLPTCNDHQKRLISDNPARAVFHGRFNGPLDFPSGSRSSSPARRGRVRVSSRASGSHSYPVTSPPGRNPPVCDGNLRVGAFIGSRPLFHPVAFGGSSHLRPQSLPHQQLINRIADWLEAHVSNVLSNPSSTAGSINASKRGQKIGNSGQKGGA